MKLIDYFDQISIIHMRDRVDRYRGLVKELRRMGIDINNEKVRIQDPPRLKDANGFVSAAVYSSFLSHLQIMKDAKQKGFESFLVLEDDAIFSRRFVNQQDELMSILSQKSWGMCFFGHTLNRELQGYERGLTPYTDFFGWSHCYAVHGSILPRLISFLERIMTNDPSNPEGGKIYFDGALNHFRRFYPDIEVLVANPVLSVQRGSPSSLGSQRSYEKISFLKPLVSFARAARDESWRQIGWPENCKWKGANAPASSLKQLDPAAQK